MQISKSEIQKFGKRLAAARGDKSAEGAVVREIDEAMGGDREVLRELLKVAYGEPKADVGLVILGRLTGSSYDFTGWLAKADSAHMALHAATALLGIPKNDMADVLGISPGRVTQLHDPANGIPRAHRLVVLGILNAAVEQHSAEVEVPANRAPMVRLVRAAMLELLTAIRNVEIRELIPPTESA